MNEQSSFEKIRVASWEELLQMLNEPARSPKFPELISTGEWKSWSANIVPPDAGSGTVEQPTRVPSRIRRFFSKGRQYCRPLLFKPLSADHIRLLDLRKARIHDNVLIGFKLVTVPLAKAPKYEAMSYCWGSTDTCTGIFISTRHHKDQVYRVTENLATCLYSLLVTKQPEADRPRYLWVDQICINQEDIHERNAQVRRMADVYKTAARVIIWLGQASKYSIDQHELDLVPDPHTIWKDKPLPDWFSEWVIFGRPWFSRLWVFQEAVFAQRISVLLGTAFTPWDTICDRSQSTLTFHLEVISGKFPFTRRVFQSLGYLVIEDITSTAEKLAIQAPVDLADLMWSLDEQEFQNSKDKVFSLVGFAADTLPADFVDYNRPIEITNQDCTRRIIERTGSLKAITYMNSEKLERRPSWVPLWHEPLWLGMLPTSDGVSASLHRKWKPTLPVMEGQLSVVGKEVDRVALGIQSFQNNMERYFDEAHFTSVLQQPFFDTFTQKLQILQRKHQNELTVNTEPGPQQNASDLASRTCPSPSESRASGLKSEALTELFQDFFQTIFFSSGPLMETDFDNLIHLSDEEEAVLRL